MNRDHIRALCPTPERARYDWSDCCAVFPRLETLEATPQSARYHAEGNVGIHTRMVLDALLESAWFAHADEARREILFLAALLHDICKPETTVIDPVSGEVSQPGHSRRGAVDVRAMLWRAGTPFETREAICRIVAAHWQAVDTQEGVAAGSRGMRCKARTAATARRHRKVRNAAARPQDPAPEGSREKGAVLRVRLAPRRVAGVHRPQAVVGARSA